MQKQYFTSFNKIFVNNVTIAADIVSFSYTFQKWYPSFAKPLVSHPKTLRFTSWNPCFHNLKPMLSDCNLMGFRKRSQYCINIQKPHPQPLPVGEGSEYPCFLLENGARRPTAPPPSPPRRRGEWIPLLLVGEQGTETLFYYGLPRRSRIVN